MKIQLHIDPFSLIAHAMQTDAEAAKMLEVQVNDLCKQHCFSAIALLDDNEKVLFLLRFNNDGLSISACQNASWHGRPLQNALAVLPQEPDRIIVMRPTVEVDDE